MALATVLMSTLGALPALAAGPSAGWKPRPATYGIVKQHNIPVTMSDGVVLETDVLRPADAAGKVAPGTFPVVLTQTPYNKATPAVSFEDDYLVERGYIQVIADVRGTGASEGTWSSFGPREQRDGFELAQWAHLLAGGTGAVGLYGASYGAINQLLTAAEHPEGLKAIFPIVPMGDAYRDVFGNGGQLDAGFMPLWAGLVNGPALVPSSLPTDPTEAVRALAGRPANLTTLVGPTLLSSMTGGASAYDGAFYQSRSPLKVIDQVDVPTFITGGEYDLFQRGEPMLYNALAARGVPAKLLIGPWTHLQASLAPGFSADAATSTDQLALRWFDHYVKGVPDSRLDTDLAPVSAYRLGTGPGAGRFRAASAFPTTGTTYQAFRLGGTSTPGGSAGTLGGRVAEGTGTIPYDPLTGLCSQSTRQWTAGVPVPVCSTEQRYNDRQGATYDLPVTAPALRFNGTSTAQLFVSTTGKDAQVTARLEDVAPDGSSTPLSTGWQVLSLRALDARRSVTSNGLPVQPYHPDTRSSALPVLPGTVYELDVEIFPTSVSIAHGHVLRLALQGADSPHLLPPATQLAAAAGGTITIHSSARYPSRLVLGVEP